MNMTQISLSAKSFQEMKDPIHPNSSRTKYVCYRSRTRAYHGIDCRKKHLCSGRFYFSRRVKWRFWCPKKVSRKISVFEQNFL